VTPGSPPEGPVTARFARTAAEYLEGGKIQEALTLCRAGIVAFPGYATGHLVLGRCYGMLGRPLEALVAFRRVGDAQPGAPAVEKLVRSMEDIVEGNYRTFIAARESPAGGPRAAMTMERFLAGAPAPPAPEQRAQAPAGIVTPTLAEIYARQGQYGEAIRTYNALMGQRPENDEHYRERIIALEALRQEQERDTTA
jgi:tetratricopeptide (TPR) repeat protein